MGLSHPDFAAYRRRLIASGNKPMIAAVALAHRAHRLAFAMLRSQAPYDDEQSAVRACGHFPNEQAALKCLHMAIRGLDRTGQGRQRWAMRWKPALNALTPVFEGRIFPNNR